MTLIFKGIDKCIERVQFEPVDIRKGDLVEWFLEDCDGDYSLVLSDPYEVEDIERIWHVVDVINFSRNPRIDNTIQQTDKNVLHVVSRRAA